MSGVTIPHLCMTCVHLRSADKDTRFWCNNPARFKKENLAKWKFPVQTACRGYKLSVSNYCVRKGDFMDARLRFMKIKKEIKDDYDKNLPNV